MTLMASSHAVSSQIQVDATGLRKHYLTLTNCQKPFVNLIVNWIKKPRKTLVVVSGGPGTGKSYLVKNTLNFLKTQQLRMSFTARSAVAIGGKTIHSTLGLHAFNKVCKELEKDLADEMDLLTTIKRSRAIMSQFHCNSYPYVVVVDEVSMVNGWFMYWVIRFFMDRTELPLLFICMGDPHQLNPVKSIHNLFSITFSEKKYDVRKIHLTECKRFVPEYERLINTLREFVDAGDETGMFDFVCEHFPVVGDIDRPLLMQADKAMAFKNETVNNYNSFYLKNKVPGPEIIIPNNITVKSNCWVFVTKNGCSQANNGTLLIFKSFDFENLIATCEDPKTGSEILVKCDAFNSTIPLTLGFAATVHKYQGDTIDNEKIVINFDGNKNLNLVYTALSRVRSMEQIIAIQM